MKSLTIIVFLLLLSFTLTQNRPKDFVNIKSIIPNIVTEIRYSGHHNFIGEPIKGYNKPYCIITEKAAIQLAKVQKELLANNLQLKIYDCYRPMRSVLAMVEWSKNETDAKMKGEFYPRVEKKNLFRDGYIAERSGHSRGSTIDLTIINVPPKEQEEYKPGDTLRPCILPYGQRFRDNSLDFGTGFDCFDIMSHTNHPNLTKTAKENRKFLVTIMKKFGFNNYEKEWWHFTLEGEPYPDTYFDFPVDD